MIQQWRQWLRMVLVSILQHPTKNFIVIKLILLYFNVILNFYLPSRGLCLHWHETNFSQHSSGQHRAFHKLKLYLNVSDTFTTILVTFFSILFSPKKAKKYLFVSYILKIPSEKKLQTIPMLYIYDSFDRKIFFVCDLVTHAHNVIKTTNLLDSFVFTLFFLFFFFLFCAEFQSCFLFLFPLSPFPLLTVSSVMFLLSQNERKGPRIYFSRQKSAGGIF